jgi:hypothetical protein
MKRLLSVLLIIILVMSCIGGVSAKHYTYEINCTVGDNLKVLEMCYDLHVAVDMVFIDTFRDSGLFRLHQKAYDPYYATAIKAGAVNLTMHYSCFDFSFYDDDYVHFIVKDKGPAPNPEPVPPIPPTPPAPENNSTPVIPAPENNSTPVIPVPEPVVPVSGSVISKHVVDSVPVVNNTIVNDSNITPVIAHVSDVSQVSHKVSNEHFIIKFFNGL